VKLAKKRRTNQNLSTSKSDIERDAIRPAKKAGKRISASGNTYYEYRDNRVDNRQPPRKYRKLADGGNTSDFDELIADKFKMQEWYESFNDGLKNLVTKKYVTKAELNKFDNYSSRRRIDPFEKYGKMSGRSAAKKFVDDNKRYDKMADGGMMASGGMFSTKQDNEVIDKAYRDKLSNNIYKTALSKEVNGFRLVKSAWTSGGGNLLWENKQIPEIHIYATPFFTPDYDINFEEFLIDTEEPIRREDKAYKLTGNIDKDTETYFNYLESKTKKYAKGKMADGGKTQGYDDKKDESLGMSRGKLSLKDFVGNRKQKEHSRRDDARFEERGMMDHGGYMADGGSLDYKLDVINQYSDEKLARIYSQMNDLDYSEILSEIKGDPEERKEIAFKIFKEVVERDNEMSNGGYMADGGSVAKGNYEMLMSQAKEVMHHAEELMQVVKPNMDIEAWVVSKAERATTDLSDITHYLDGLKMAMGGMVKNNAHKVNG
jgi:hypothetical protein